jgi:transcriptional regulator with XRE-family HTH domain
MPEMSFGRSIRYRRTRIGLSQSRLGELVGRSGAAVRSWERDASVPTDVSVLQALSAVLGIETGVLFEKAGVAIPAVETSPTVEEVLGSLTSVEEERVVEVPPRFEVSLVEVETSAPEEFEQFSLDDQPEDADADLTADLPIEEPPEPVPVSSAPLPVSKPSNRGTFALSPPTEPRFRYTTPAPPVLEPTYMEDQSQRQLYRVRHLATLVLVVALIVLFVWALGNSVEAFASWWDDFFGTFQV